MIKQFTNNFFELVSHMFPVWVKGEREQMKERRDGQKLRLRLSSMSILIRNKLKFYGSYWKSFKTCLHGTRDN
jgi:hypothetical protein